MKVDNFYGEQVAYVYKSEGSREPQNSSSMVGQRYEYVKPQTKVRPYVTVKKIEKSYSENTSRNPSFDYSNFRSGENNMAKRREPRDSVPNYLSKTGKIVHSKRKVLGEDPRDSLSKKSQDLRNEPYSVESYKSGQFRVNTYKEDNYRENEFKTVQYKRIYQNKNQPRDSLPRSKKESNSFFRQIKVEPKDSVRKNKLAQSQQQPYQTNTHLSSNTYNHKKIVSQSFKINFPPVYTPDSYQVYQTSERKIKLDEPYYKIHGEQLFSENNKYQFQRKEEEQKIFEKAIPKQQNFEEEEIVVRLSQKEGKEEKEEKEDKTYELQNNYLSNNKVEVDVEGENNNMEDLDKEPEDGFSKFIFNQINKIRQNPKSFVNILMNSKQYIKRTRKGQLVYKKNKCILLNRGEEAFDEAIEELSQLHPMERLIFNEEITVKPPENEQELVDKDYLNREVYKLLENDIIIKAYWRDIISDPETCLILMIVDDNSQETGQKRRDILDPNMKYMGISSSKFGKNFCSFMTFANK